MKNLPVVRLGVVAVSRDCFPRELSLTRRKALVDAAAAAGLSLYEAQTVVQNEREAVEAVAELKKAGVNAAVVFLGNFGPEDPETMIAARFGGPCMFVAAAEESGDSLYNGRGDAYCGMLNASYSLGLKGLRAYIPEYPVGTAKELAEKIAVFEKVARVYLGVKGLKVFGFGPRPFNFLACNAPIKPFFDLGVNVQENSELDLYESYLKHADDKRIEEVAADMAAELGREGNRYPSVLPKLAQFELTLLDWFADNLDAAEYGTVAVKCWPAFQNMFGFVPCYVNSRLTAMGIPVACETDLYGALSEYIIACATGQSGTLLDINNTVPADMIAENSAVVGKYKPTDLFMGFHCGNTSVCHLKKGQMKNQLIMHRLLEPDSEPNITRGTLEGTLADGDVTLFRLQSTADARLTSYIAEGEVLDLDPKSFGGIGVIAVPEMGRFYRHVLIEKRFPHHAGVAFEHAGLVLFEAMKLLGVTDISYNRPAGLPYPTENPFAK